MISDSISSYIYTGEFLKDLHHPVSSIIWEKEPDGIDFPADVHHYTFAQFGYDFSEKGELAALLHKNKRVILILETLSSAEVAPLLSHIPSSCVCSVLNIGAGITGIINKHTLDTLDITNIPANIPIYEPIDIHQIHHILDVEHTHYMRIANDEIQYQLFDESNHHLYKQPYVSFIGFGYTGQKGTILTIPSLLPQVSQALQHIQTTEGVGYDLFVVTHYGLPYSPELLTSIGQTERLIVIHDQSDDQAAKKLCVALPKDITVSYKHPSYDALQTILPEYIHEKAGVDGDSIAHYLLMS